VRCPGESRLRNTNATTGAWLSNAPEMGFLT